MTDLRAIMCLTQVLDASGRLHVHTYGETAHDTESLECWCRPSLSILDENDLTWRAASLGEAMFSGDLVLVFHR